MTFVENEPVKKVGVLSNVAIFYYVNSKDAVCGKPLWKTPVENSVETVEKLWFSTGIS